MELLPADDVGGEQIGSAIDAFVFEVEDSADRFHRGSLLYFGYATGVFSSRQLERATYDSVASRYGAGNRHPDHDAIAQL